MTLVTLAATQMAIASNEADTLDRAEALVRDAAEKGAQIILLQELFAGPYFCQDERPEDLMRAKPLNDCKVAARFADLARELGVVMPISFYEEANMARFNSLAMADADGQILGIYRKSHIPHGSGYQEKFYFSPGDTGFRVWETAFGKVGAGICWDQWFPEAARAMALQGADVLLYPTAIGSELFDPAADTSGHWRRVMQGHAGANLVPLVASNRIGTEQGHNGTSMTFYGTSFIAGIEGEILADLDRTTGGVAVATVDFKQLAEKRAAWGIFRDRRPDLYGPLLSLDGGPNGKA
ncbi:MAG: N-carbamoylputrescine amidase [Pseudomonadota bacterium]